jgi:hypothetical protein
MLPFGPEPLVKIRIYRTILPVVRYMCETWSLTLMEEHKLRVFKKRVLRRYLDREGMKNYQVEENDVGGACSTNGGRGTRMLLIRKPERKRSLGRPRHR